MAFPVTKRYFVSFRNSDTGLVPVFVYFKNAATFAPITPPVSIPELSNGRYYFDWTWTTKTDPDIILQIDGGASIPTEEVRYANGQISPKDVFLDEPVSQVVTDVWTDNTAYAAGQKGLRLDQVGDPANTSANATVFGKVLLYKEAIRGDGAGLSDGNNVKEVQTRLGVPTLGASIAAGIQQTDTDVLTVNTKIGVPVVSIAADIAAVGAAALTPTQIAAAVLDALLSAHTVAGSVGEKIGLASTATNVSSAITSIKGVDGVDLTNLAGTGFVSATHGLKATSDNLIRALGMLHENSVLDLTTFDGSNNLLQGRMRLYDSAANADAAVAASPGVYNTGKIAEYNITATYTGSNLKTYEVAKV